MEVAILNWGRHPATAHCDVANEPGKYERKKQRYSERDQIERRQLNSPQNEAKRVEQSSQFAEADSLLVSLEVVRPSTIPILNPRLQSPFSKSLEEICFLECTGIALTNHALQHREPVSP